MKELIQAIEEVANEVAEARSNTTIDFSVETYNLIAGVWEEQNRIATALERIASVLEKQNG